MLVGRVNKKGEAGVCEQRKRGINMGFFLWPQSSKTKVIEVKNRGEEIEKILREADKNGDGVWNKEELKEAFRKLGAWFPGWRANGGLSAADLNKDGVISENELAEVIKYAKSKYGYK